MSEENNDHQLFIIDPLSIIIKLAILSYKPIGTKILIHNNVIYFQEPGIFQGITRYFLNTNKNNLQYLYNPIHIACKKYLIREFKNTNAAIITLFEFAKNGLIMLIKTYNNHPLITLCLNFYYTIIDNYMKDNNNVINFKDDEITPLYTNEILTKFTSKWSVDKIKVVLDLIIFLKNDASPIENVKSLEIFMGNFDKDIILLKN
jgi:uncharacterized protein YqgQ